MRKQRNIIMATFAAAALLVGIGANAGSYAGSDTELKQDTLKTEERVPEHSIVDEVIWVVGDQPILKSDVEMMKLQGEMEGMTWNGDPDYIIPEQIAVQKLFLHQAEIDSINVTEAEISQNIEMQINRWIQQAGSKEKLEEYKKMTVTQMRQQLHDDFRNNQLIQQMREKLVSDIAVTPADVRKYFNNLPEDSIPLVPTQVEVEIITKQPKISQEEINHVKNELREYTDRITSGETSFGTLARLYSEDPGSARQGGEMDYVGRGMLDPAFAAVAFNLTDRSACRRLLSRSMVSTSYSLSTSAATRLRCATSCASRVYRQRLPTQCA